VILNKPADTPFIIIDNMYRLG